MKLDLLDWQDKHNSLFSFSFALLYLVGSVYSGYVVYFENYIYTEFQDRPNKPRDSLNWRNR